MVKLRGLTPFDDNDEIGVDNVGDVLDDNDEHGGMIELPRISSIAIEGGDMGLIRLSSGNGDEDNEGIDSIISEGRVWQEEGIDSIIVPVDWEECRSGLKPLIKGTDSGKETDEKELLLFWSVEIKFGSFVSYKLSVVFSLSIRGVGAFVLPDVTATVITVSALIPSLELARFTRTDC